MFHAIPRSRGRFKRPAQLLEGLKARLTAGWFGGWKWMEENDQEEKGVQNVCFRWVFQYNLSVDVFGAKIHGGDWPERCWGLIDVGHLCFSPNMTWNSQTVYLPTWNPWNQLKKVRVNVGKMYHFPFTLWYMVCDRFWRHCFMVVSARWYSNLLCFSDFQVAQSRSVSVRMPSNWWLIHWHMDIETHY